MSTYLRIAIDGGAATGKSTVAKIVSQKLGITYINTGQMYRLIALIALKNGLQNNERELFEAIKDVDMSFDKEGNIQTSSIDLGKDILNSNEVSETLVYITAYPLIREFASQKQIIIGKQKGILLEGRDIGTVIMPDADFKFYLSVDPEIAAKRRVKHFKRMGEDISYEKTLQDILERNESDMTRKIAPLKAAEDSIHIDTSSNTAKEIAEEIVEAIKNG